jgi:hypothetical protein
MSSRKAVLLIVIRRFSSNESPFCFKRMKLVEGLLLDMNVLLWEWNLDAVGVEGVVDAI